MIILALDTTTVLCSVALIRDGEVIDCAVEAGQSHSSRLLPMIDRLLAEASVGLPALDAIAFGAGPGSFTGVRIACGVAQGLAFGAGRPVIPVDSLEAMALASGAAQVMSCLDARMGEVYFAAYRREPFRGSFGTARGDAASDVPRDRLVATIPAGVFAPAAVPLPADKRSADCDDLSRKPFDGADWVGCGSGFGVYAPALAGRLGNLSRIASDIAPHARQVAQLAAIAFSEGRAIAPDLAAPRYVRNKVALDAVEQAALRARVTPAGGTA